MKKSEMRRLLERWGVRFALPENLPLEGAGDAILRQMEEKGQAWDPEEPELPARLFYNAPNVIADAVLADNSFKPWIFTIPENDKTPHLNPFRKKVALEAIRRYNLVPELRATIDLYTVRDNARDLARQLLALLDSKAH